MTTSRPTLICLGVVTGAHGVNGAVKVKCFTESPENLTAYGPLTNKSAGNEFRLKFLHGAESTAIVQVEGVPDRTTAEALKGLELYVSRDKLPNLPDGRYYHADLIGLSVHAINENIRGTVRAINNYGAGDILEVELEHDGKKRTELLPYSQDTVLNVDMAMRVITLKLPEFIEAKKKD